MKPKLATLVPQLLTSISKIYAGQLVETAREIQIEELRLAVMAEESSKAEAEYGVLSEEGRAKLQEEIERMGPIQPYHLRCARQRLIQEEKYIDSKPKSMFLRKL